MTTRQPAPNPQTLRDALRELPEATPPDDVWAEIERRTGARPRRGSPGAWLAVAAAVLLTASMGAWMFARAPATPGNELASLMAQSQQLERRLARRGTPESAEWGASRRALVYRIADLDRELAPLSINPSRDPMRAERLWRQRVALMQSLAELDRADAPHRTLAL